MGYLFVFLLIQAFEPERFFPGGSFWDFLAIALLIIGSFHYFPVRAGMLHYFSFRNVRGFLIFSLFLLIFIISLFRTSSFLNTDLTFFKNAITLVLLPVFLYCYYQYKEKKGELSELSIFLTIVHALGFFCFVNLISWILNPSFGDGAATTFSMLGINTKSIVFPMYPRVHPNSVGALGGFLLVLAVGFYRHVENLKPGQRFLMIAYIFIGFIIILMGDSRGTLAGALFTVICLYFFMKAKKYSYLKYTVLLLPFSHVLFILTLQFAAGTSVASSISTGSSSDLATGNSRKFIYMAANNELADFKPVHMVGFGEYGIYGAGLTKYYMNKFGYESKEQRLLSSVAHNSALQAVFDIGYIGLVVYLLLLFLFFSQSQQLYESGFSNFILVSYFLVYNIITGISETHFGNYYAFQNFLFIILAFYVINAYNVYLVKKETGKSEEKGKLAV